MTEENWVKLPEPYPSTLPVGTRWRCEAGEFLFDAEYELKGLQSYFPARLSSGFLATGCIGVQLPPGYRFEGSEVVKDEAKPATFAQAWAWAQQNTQQGFLAEQVAQAAHLQNEAITRAYQAQALYQGIESPIAREVREEQKKPLLCKCGASENLSYEWADWGKSYQCGPCYQARRRAELAAQKLEQAKSDLGRPVQKKRDPYEWLGFSSASWEE